jgi:uncharacterized protein YkwD
MTANIKRSALAVIATAAMAGLGAAPVHAVTCKNVDLNPVTSKLSTVENATRCLINKERTARGLNKLHADDALALAAKRHAKDMVARKFFDHVSPGGATPKDRIVKAGYGNFVALGENIAWGSGSLGTPRQIVRSWMRSPGHKENILKRSFKDFGIGVARGVPERGKFSGGTYVNTLGAHD